MLAHVFLSKLKEAIDLLPELFLGWHGCLLIDVDVAKIQGLKDAHGRLEALIALEVCQLAGLGESEDAESWVR